MISREELNLAEKTLQFALDSGAAQARVTLTRSVMNSIATLNSETDKVSQCLDRAIMLALFVDNRYGSYSTNKLDEEELKAFVKHAVAMTRLLTPDPLRQLPDPARCCTTAITGDELGLYDNTINDVSPAGVASETCATRVADKVGCGDSLLQQTCATLGIIRGGTRRVGSEQSEDGLRNRATSAADSIFNIISTEAEYSENEIDSVLLDSNGVRCRQMETSFEYVMEVTVEDEQGNKYNGYWWDASPFKAKLDTAAVEKLALERTVAQMHPRPLESGKYTMIVDTSVASKMVTPLLNALGGFSLQQGNSFLMDSLGRKVFSEGLTIVDDPARIGETGSHLFDSEGVATMAGPIIENGTVKRYFLSDYMARKMKMEPTGEDPARAVVKPWSADGIICKDASELMRRTGEGILVTGFNGGNSNSATGDFSFGIEGFYYKDGKKVHPVHEMLITGNFIELWNRLIACAEDFRPCMSKLIPSLAFGEVDFTA